jgi:hypothetical protein
VLINVREVVEGPATYIEGIVLDITDGKRQPAALRGGFKPFWAILASSVL